VFLLIIFYKKRYLFYFNT